MEMNRESTPAQVLQREKRKRERYIMLFLFLKRAKKHCCNVVEGLEYLHHVDVGFSPNNWHHGKCGQKQTTQDPAH